MIGFLIVEDDDSLRDAYEVLIRKKYSDAHIDHVANGIDAFKKAKTHDYTIMIIDIGLPRLNGIEFYKKLKKYCPAMARRAIFISGNIFDFDLEAINEERCSYLAKPFANKDFYTSVSHVISQEQRDFLSKHRTNCRRKVIRGKAGEECTVIIGTQLQASFKHKACKIIDYSIGGLSVQHDKEWRPEINDVSVSVSRFNIHSKEAKVAWTKHVDGATLSGLQWA
jgi:YesN/AraC family two-component response regulator